MNSEKNGLGIEFSDDQLAMVQTLAGYGFMPRKIGITLGIPVNLLKWFIEEIETEGSTLNLHYLKGQYLTEANARKNLTNSSKGSFTAFKEMRELNLESEIDELKRSLEVDHTTSLEPQRALRAQYKDSLDHYVALKEFVATGASDNLPAHLQEYWNRLSTVHDLTNNFNNRGKGRKYIVRMLRMKYPDVTENRAYLLINEAISFFNVDLERSHWRNVLCESLDKVIAVSWKMNRMDWIIKAIREQSQIQGLHLPEADQIPDDLLEQKTIIITSKAKEFGYDSISRKDLLAKIKQYQISKIDKQRLARDAGITDIDFEETDE